MEKRKRLLGICLLLLFLFCSPARASEQNLYIDGNLQRLFTAENGLLSNSVLTIAQTPDGFIWLGGYGGLIRYDGRNMMPIQSSIFSEVSDLLANEDGTLWIASADAGVIKYYQDTLTPITGGQADEVYEVKSLCEAADGTIYFGTQNGIGYVNEDEALVKLDIPMLQGFYIRDLQGLPDGGLCCITRTGELFHFTRNGDAWFCEYIEIHTEEKIRSLCVDTQNQSIWIGTDKSTLIQCSMDFTEISRKHLKGFRTINVLTPGSHGALWICADNGIGVLWEDEILTEELKLNNSIDSMMIDLQGNYWFGSSRQGLLEVSPSRFKNISQIAGLKDLVVNAIITHAGRLYIGSDTGIDVLDAETYLPIDDPIVQMFRDKRVRALYVDEEEQIWVATTGEGLWRVSADREAFLYDTNHYPVLSTNNFRTFHPIEGGLIVGSDAGAYLLKDGEIRNLLNNPADVPCRILGIEVIGDRVYLGSDGYGLFIVEDGKVLQRLSNADGLPSNVVMKLYPGSAPGTLWLVTGSFLTYLDEEGEIRQIRGYPYRNTLDFLILKDGNCLIPYGAGLTMTTEENLLSGNFEDVQVHNRSDGLPYEITANSSQCFSGNTLYLCGNGGVIAMSQNYQVIPPQNWHLVINSIRTDGVRHYVQHLDSFLIEKNVKRIEIEAHNLTYQSDNPMMFYFLEGFDTERFVANLNDIGTITYTNLPSGHYLFHYGILDPTGNVEAEVTLPLQKERCWYETPQAMFGFMVGIVALVSILVYTISSYRVRKIDEKRKRAFKEEEHRRLSEIAYRDYLTGLFTRNYIDLWVSQILPQAKDPIVLVSLDLNDLKVINDRFGHKSGDELLCAFSDCMKECFHEDSDTIIRLGGDEFLIISHGSAPEEIERRIGQLQTLAHGKLVAGTPITFGYGIHVSPKENFDFEEGLRMSDLEMLKDKARFHGRHQSFYEAELGSINGMKDS